MNWQMMEEYPKIRNQPYNCDVPNYQVGRVSNNYQNIA
jgi:hypothetical protein